MKLQHNNTDFKFEFNILDSNIGLNDDDHWLIIRVCIKNSDIDLDVCKSILSLSELKKLNIELKRLLDGEYKRESKYQLIKHIAVFKFFPDKTMKLKLYIYDQINKYYELLFTEEEVKEFLKMNEEFLSRV